jgi:hypothetical protein
MTTDTRAACGKITLKWIVAKSVVWISGSWNFLRIKSSGGFGVYAEGFSFTTRTFRFVIYTIPNYYYYYYYYFHVFYYLLSISSFVVCYLFYFVLGFLFCLVTVCQHINHKHGDLRELVLNSALFLLELVSSTVVC